ncbi:MAG: hypothetical protein IJI21_00765 [Clostridia bacterium]|nr:hypothetical protein [Clostridia bacterium]
MGDALRQLVTGPIELLLVKDFNEKGPFRISGDFMTNADLPTLAFRGLVEAPVNPFTGEPDFVGYLITWENS